MKTRKTIKKADYADYALAICMGEKGISTKYNVEVGTTNNYISYAKGSASNREQAKKTYYKLGQKICRYIDEHIDAGRHCDLRYRSFEKIGPTTNKKIKQPATQLKLDFSPVKKEEKPVKATLTVSDVMVIVKQMYEVTMEALRKV